MAVPIEFVTLIIPKTELERSLEGGLDAYFELCSAPSYLEDEHLTRVSFMAHQYTYELLEQVLALGMPEQRDGVPTFAVLDRSSDSTTLPPWLEIGVVDEVRCVWLHGKRAGLLVSPPRVVSIRGVHIPRDALATELSQHAVEVHFEAEGKAEDCNLLFRSARATVEAFCIFRRG